MIKRIISFALILVIMVSFLPVANANDIRVAISGSQWLQGQGVDVISQSDYSGSYQCVELAFRLYNKHSWPRVYADGGVGAGTYREGAKYIPEGSPGLKRHNPGSGYVPVPGDLIIENGTASNGYGHVAIVDRVEGNNIFAVEQNGGYNHNGRHTYYYNNSNYSGGSGTIKCILHAPANTFTNPLPTASASIANGVYTIQAKTGKYVVGTYDPDDGDNVFIYEENITSSYGITDDFRWELTRLPDNSYRILNVHRQQVLDVDGGSKTSGANVKTWNWTDNSAQHWYIVDYGSGWYEFVAKCSNMALDVKSGNSANGTNIQQYTRNNTDAQRFKLQLLPEPLPTGSAQEVADGVYRIKSKLATNKYVTTDPNNKNNGGNVMLWDNNSTANQLFSIERLPDDDAFKITSLNSGRVLDVEKASTADKANVQIYTWNETSAQRWYVVSCGDGWYKFVAKCSGRVLDIASANTVNGANIQQYKWNGTDAQKFKLETLPVVYADNIGTDFYAALSLEAYPDSYVSVDGSFTAGNDDKHIFYLTRNSNGTYSIRSKYNGYLLDASNYNNTEGTIVQFSAGTTPNAAQQWRIQKVGPSYILAPENAAHFVLDLNPRQKLLRLYTPNGSWVEKSDGLCQLFTITVFSKNGDVSGDGNINMQDVLMIYQYFRGNGALTPEQLALADVNGDGIVNMQDVLLVYQYFRGKIAAIAS